MSSSTLQKAYRSLALVDERGPVKMEASYCFWCRHCHRSDELTDKKDHRDRLVRNYQWWCAHPLNGGVDMAKVEDVNPTGQCPLSEPSWVTRWLRRMRLGRAPVMVDPMWWDDLGKDVAKP